MKSNQQSINLLRKFHSHTFVSIKINEEKNFRDVGTCSIIVELTKELGLINEIYEGNSLLKRGI